MQDAVIIEAVRTASGKGKPSGQFAGVHPSDLLAQTLTALLENSGVAPDSVDDVIGGCVSQSGDQAVNVTRTAWLSAGFPESVPATTVDRQCGSSQQAAHFAAQGVMAGAYDAAIACGVESMSRVVMGSSSQGGAPFGGKGLRARYPDGLVSQGVSAELIAARWGLDRETLDAFSVRSHERAALAAADGGFDRELVAVQHEGSELTVDETVRPGTDAAGLAGLSPAFADPTIAERFDDIDEWKITPGNSSPLTDGASAMLIMSRAKADELGLTPRARFHAFAVVGDDPLLMLTGPIPATRNVLERAGMAVGDIDAFEVNEAFAPVPLAWAQELGADLDRVNVRGGAIALGHPLGASGTRLMTTLLHTLEDEDGQWGLQTMCEGGGLANATIIERL